jgi:OFA family oxalate/formate antiporter-like MFS transporter
VGALLLMGALGIFHAWSLVVAALGVRFGLSLSVVSAVYAAAVGCFALGMLTAPRIVRGVAPAAAAAGAAWLGAAGLALVSLGSPWALWVGYAGFFGVANGVGYSVALQTVQSALPQRRGFATSLAVTAYAVGPAALAPVLELGVRRLGVLETFALMAGIVALAGAAQLPLLAGARTPVTPVAPNASRRTTIYDRTFWSLWLGFFLSSAAGLAVFAHAAPLILALGGGATAATLGTALLAIGNAVGRLLGGSLTDVLEARRVMVAAGVVGAAGLLGCAWLLTAGSALAGLAATGVYYGMVSSAVPAAVGRFYGIARLTFVYGRLFTAWGAAGLVAPIVAGVAFDSSGSYRIALLGAGIAALGSIAVALLLPHSDAADPEPKVEMPRSDG